MENVNFDIAIVGAGICGLMAGAVLTTRGQRVIVLDKGRSVGGRLATRRVGAGRADPGAQFFTVRTPVFAEWVQRWQAKGIVFAWSTGWSDGSLAETLPDGHPRYAVHGGMNALAKHLAAQVAGEGATIRTGVRVNAITLQQASSAPADAVWKIGAEDGSITTARAVVLTAPAPQSLALLDAGGSTLADADRSALAAIQYAPCVCGLLTVNGAVDLPMPGALQRPAAEISWIADNRRKGISPEATVITLHGGPVWSQGVYDESDAVVLAAFRAALQPWLSADASVSAEEVKRWRYAVPTSLHPERMLRLAARAPLYCGGDGFGEPRVEGAALSGLAIGHALAQELA